MADEDYALGSGLAIDSTFTVSEDIVIKQEPQDPVPESVDIVEEDVAAAVDADAEVSYGDLTFAEISDVVMQRAVSPPSYDLQEERIKELLYYTEKHNLKEVKIELERCDKIWETLQLIKNFQDSFCDDNDVESQSSASDRLLSYQRSISNAVPDFRFSVKSKRKLYYCITCGKEYSDSQHLRQHAIDEHGIFVNPKRIYKPRVGSSVSEKDSNELDKEKEFSIEDENLSVPKSVETKPLVQEVETTIPQNDPKPANHVAKTSGGKEKIKCVLCKRICTDIVYHMKGYHKVGCISSIIAQCEKITDNVPSDVPADVPANNEVVPPVPSSDDLDQSVTVPMRKRKRNTTCWTIKKKYKLMNKSTTKQLPSGPFKCNVCLGIYKTIKSYSYHKSLHQMRGETPENFDPSKCRFLNSPLRLPAKTTHSVPEKASESATDQREATKIEPTKFVLNDVERTNEEQVLISQDSGLEQTKCECGRSFRNYHTLYLHKVKCKGPTSQTDADSGIGISIKIKKNKNDSYEVVPSNIKLEENNYKDSRNSKDSDASSNDSGMVSVDYNNQRLNGCIDFSSKYDKNHSIMRIQAAEDDEEVDIEDGEVSNKDNWNENCETEDIKPIIINNESDILKARNFSVIDVNSLKEQNVDGSIKCANEENRTIPSLVTLCKQALNEENVQSKNSSSHENLLNEHVPQMDHNRKSNCPCGKNFKNFKYLNIHVKRYHPLLLKCGYCATNFDRVELYIQHMCKVMEGKLFIEPIIQTQCTECQALVDLGEEFDKHMKIHLDSGIFQCFKCDLKFNNQHQRESHFNIEHGFSLCRICSKLMHIDYLSNHEAYHDGLGHPCHVCKKAFDQKTLLKKHVQNTHDPSVNQLVKCPVCFKEMKLKILKKHLSFHLHTEICGKCNKCLMDNDQEKIENQQVAFNHDTIVREDIRVEIREF